MSESVVEKIKQEGKTLNDLDDLLVKALEDDEEFERLEKSKWVLLKGVLEILEGFVVVEKQKRQDAKNSIIEFVKREGERYGRISDDWFREEGLPDFIEKKFAELGLKSTEEK